MNFSCDARCRVLSLLAVAPALVSLTCGGMIWVPPVMTTIPVGGTVSGVLAAGDRQLTTGEFYDEWTFLVSAGQAYSVRMASTNFDAYVIVIDPTGQQMDNDDFGGVTDAGIDLVAAARGTMRAMATTYASGAYGSYTLSVFPGAAGGAPVGAGPLGAPAGAPSSAYASWPNVGGRLAPGDREVVPLRYADDWALPVRAGQQVSVRLTSSEFDPFLVVRFPGSDQAESDDFDGRNSGIDGTATADGLLQIAATSYRAEESGSYLLWANTGTPFSVAPSQNALVPYIPPPVPTSYPWPSASGFLGPGDTVLPENKYADGWTLPLQAGQQVSLRVVSSDFDPTISVVAPGGETFANDDLEGFNAGVDITASQAGPLSITVTSYRTIDAQPQAGNYVLYASAGVPVAASVAAAPPPGPPGIPSYDWPNVRGALREDDKRTSAGWIADAWEVPARAGEPLSIRMASTAFDAFVAVVEPDGWVSYNDDLDGSHAGIDFVPLVDGTVLVFATSSGENRVGEYALWASSGTPVAAQWPDPEPSDPVPPADQAVWLDGGPVSPGTTVGGQLAEGDATRSSGTFYDSYSVDVEAGRALTIRCQSSDFDAALTSTDPSGGLHESDDVHGTDPGLHWVVATGGRVQIFVTSAAPGETGRYTLSVY